MAKERFLLPAVVPLPMSDRISIRFVDVKNMRRSSPVPQRLRTGASGDPMTPEWILLPAAGAVPGPNRYRLRVRRVGKADTNGRGGYWWRWPGGRTSLCLEGVPGGTETVV